MAILENRRYELFAQNLAIGMLTNEAYLAAGFQGVGSETHCKAATELLRRRPEINERVQEINRQSAIAAGITAERILSELGKIAFSNIKDYVSWQNGQLYLKDSSEIPDCLAGAIESLRMTKDGPQIKFYDKRAALVDLGKHLGLFKEKEVENMKTASLESILRMTLGDSSEASKSNGLSMHAH